MAIDINALIIGAKQAIMEAEPEDVEVLLGEEIVRVRLWPMPGDEWRALAAQHSPRFEVVDGERVHVTADAGHGFNVDTLVPAYPRVALVQGDEEQALDADTWGRIVAVLQSDALAGVAAVIAFMNIARPAQRTVAALGKAWRGGNGTKPGSPASSASQSES